MNAAFRTARRVADQIEAAQITGVELGQEEAARQIIAQACRSAQCLPDLCINKDQPAAREIARLLQLARSGNTKVLTTAQKLCYRLMVSIQENTFPSGAAA